ncbi:MAG: hypothetical protein RMJ07_02620 [Nitrososphaerota archaeon]|nr:hypothetical protein [Candidatus Bathyarchaeota archaeon]MDW8048560.1 hypothetical protein [Nitrososphaerota archaeon]
MLQLKGKIRKNVEENYFHVFNLFGGAYLAQDVDADLDEIYEKWLEYGLLSPLRSESEMNKPIKPSSPKAVINLKDFMRASWSVMEKTVYIRGAPFSIFGGFPPSIKDAFEALDVRCRWEPSFSKLLEPTEENLKVIFEEKDLALKEVKRLPEILNVDELGLPKEMVDELNTMLDLYNLYVAGFNICAKAIFLARKALNTKNKKDMEEAWAALKSLSEYKNELSNKLKETSYTHLVYVMLSTDILSSLEADIRSSLEAVAP